MFGEENMSKREEIDELKRRVKLLEGQQEVTDYRMGKANGRMPFCSPMFASFFGLNAGVKSLVDSIVELYEDLALVKKHFGIFLKTESEKKYYAKKGEKEKA